MPDYFSMAGISALQLLIKYVILFGMAYLIGRWHRNRCLREYGVKLGNGSIKSYLALGLLAGIFINILPDGLLFLDLAANGSSSLVPPELPGKWSLGFWVFQFVGNFGLVAIFEELFFRGYYQTRLSEDFGIATAIWIQSFMFAFSHTRFIQADIFQLGTLLGLILTSILFGFMLYKTGSLIPPIIGHAVINLPTTGAELRFFLGFSLAVVLIFWKPILSYAWEIWNTLIRPRSIRWVLVGIGIVLAISLPLLVIPESLILWALIGLIIAFVIERKEKEQGLAGSPD
jgi:membrane protease YdiL (CAAX protease family)